MGLNERVSICLCFVGHGYELILLKLMRMLKNLGYKPHILDHTKEHTIYYSVTHIDGIDPERQELDVVDAFYRISVPGQEGSEENLLDIKDVSEKTCIIELYDYEGMPKEKSLKVNDQTSIGATTDTSTKCKHACGMIRKMTVIVTDEHRWHLEALKSLREKPEGSILVLKDYSGAAAKSIDEITLSLNPEMVYALPFSDKDHKISILSENTRKRSTGSISTELRKILYELIKRILPDIDDKALKRAGKT